MHTRPRVGVAAVLVAIAALLIPARDARAQQAGGAVAAPPPRPRPVLLINDGVSVSTQLANGDTGSPYVFLGVNVLVPVADRFSLVPGLVVEVSPKAGNWGFVGSLSANYRMSKRTAFEVQGVVGHDQDPLSGASGFFAFGPSIVFILPKGVAIGPAVLFGRGFSDRTWNASPTLNFYFAIH